jgi:hypothetical protein
MSRLKMGLGLAACLVGLSGCKAKVGTSDESGKLTDGSSCFTALDPSQLGSVLDCYYGATKGAGRYGFLSKPSQSQIGEDAFEATLPKPESELKAESLGVDDRDGASYARVSVTTRDRTRHCTDVQTQTWLMEGKRWRRVLLPKLEADARRKIGNRG